MSTPARKRLMRDFKRLQQDPPAGISGAPQDNNIMLWNAVIFGYFFLSLFLSFFDWFFALPFCLSTCFDNSNSGFLVFFLVWFVDLMILLGMEVGTFDYYCFCKSFFMVIMSIDCWWFIVLIFPFLKLQLLNSWWIICGFWVFLVVMLLGFGWQWLSLHFWLCGGLVDYGSENDCIFVFSCLGRH